MADAPHNGTVSPDPDAEGETPETLRPLLFSIAYRMIGVVRDAEDLVQETLLRLHNAEASGVEVRSRKAFSSAVVTRLAVDHLRSARVQREDYVGQWLPEPVVTPRGDSPEEQAELADSLSLAFLVLLESLSPPERAVFLLHDVLGFDYAHIAGIIAKSEVNTRQIAVRARQALDARRPRFAVDRIASWDLADRFFAAVRSGDTGALVEMLSADAMMYGDGGGRVPTRPEPVTPAPVVAELLVTLWRASTSSGERLVPVTVNGDPGAVLVGRDGVVRAVVGLEIAGGEVRTIRSILNPDKLPRLGWLSGEDSP